MGHTVINIDIIQNTEFSMGYPYNSPIDVYFKSLSPEFIDDYNISDVELQAINTHKISTERFDQKLYTFVREVSNFIQDFDGIKTNIIGEYETHRHLHSSLLVDRNKLEENRSSLEEEFFFMEENRNKLDKDLLETEELITYYKSQLMTNTIVDVGSYIEQANSDILIIDDSLAMILNAINHYDDIINSTMNSYISDLTLVSMYSFEEVLLKTSFEAWLIRPEDYYKKLVQHYRPSYDLMWSAGQSIMYDKNIEYVNNSKNIVQLNAMKLSSELIKQYKFSIEKKLKLYTINIVDDIDMNPQELQDKILDKHIEYLTDSISELATIETDKQYAIDSVISYAEYQDYNKFKELIQLKKHYISTNINIICENGTDELNIEQYDNQIEVLRTNYEVVEAKRNSITYWTYFYDHLVYDNVLIELKHVLDVLELTKKGTINQDVDVTFIEEKILFYNNVKINILEKIQILINVKDSKIIDKMEINDSITLLNSNIFATAKLIDEAVILYESSFSERLSFYFQNEDISEYEGLISLISNTAELPIITELKAISSYDSNLKWWNIEDKTQLLTMYSEITDVLLTTIKHQWDSEFNHEINRNNKIAFYQRYLQSSILNVYARMVQFINYKTYNETIESSLMESILHIIKLMDDYIEMTILVEGTISIPTTFYDYTQIVEFNFVLTDKKEEVLEVIENHLMNNFSYISEINLNYKLKITQAAEELKINTMWENMEKKYV